MRVMGMHLGGSALGVFEVIHTYRVDWAEVLGWWRCQQWWLMGLTPLRMCSYHLQLHPSALHLPKGTP